MGGPASGRPAQPFTAGNEAAVRHGALSPSLVKADAVALLAALRGSGASWLDGLDEAEVAAWAFAEAQARRLRVFVEEHGMLDGSGRPRPAADLSLRVERAAGAARDRLGLSPSARARLRRDLAAVPLPPPDIEALIAAMDGPEVGA